MPAVPYLQPGEYAAYGIPNASDANVQTASSVVNAYLKRPEGLVWTPDLTGRPAFMAALDPLLTLVTAGSISAGASVTVVVAPSTGAGPANLTQDEVGKVVVLDRANTAVEACVIQAVGPGTVTLTQVFGSHASGCTVDFGLVLSEERQLPSKRAATRVSRKPVARILSGQGRYGYGRRSDQMAELDYEFNLLSTLQSFGGPPQWFPFDPQQCGVSVDGTVWVPAGLYIAVYSEVRLHYVSGWPATSIPAAIKAATAQVTGWLGANSVAAGYRRFKGGGLDLEMWSNTAIQPDVARDIAGYRASTLY